MTTEFKRNKKKFSFAATLSNSGRGVGRGEKKKKKNIKTSVFDEIPDQNVRINAYKTVDNSPVYNLLTYSK